MKNIKIIDSFETFKLTKKSMSKVTGSRTKFYGESTTNGMCTKVIDYNDGRIKKIKSADRFEDRC